MKILEIKNKTVLYDDEDHDKIKKYKWYLHKEGESCEYIVSISSKIRMARLIMNPKKSEHVDHIKRYENLIDNRKSNLRIATQQQNMFNQRAQKNKSSKFKGVSWCKIKKKWRAHITKNYIYHHLGYFENEQKAAFKYDLKAKEMFGDFALTNKMEGLYE